MVKGVKNNFLFLKPNTSFTITLIFWVALQLAVLFVQQKKPRFLLTRACIERITENYHRYEHTFEDEAKLSSYSLLSNISKSERKPTDYSNPAEVEAKKVRTQ